MSASSSSSRAAASAAQAMPGRVARVERARADLGQRRGRRCVVLGARVAVAEVGGEVEGQRVGQPRGLGDRLGMVGEARGHRLGRREHVGCGCRGAAARRRRAWCARGWRRTRPAAARARRVCAWTLPVATHGTPSRSRQRGQAAVQRAVVAARTGAGARPGTRRGRRRAAARRIVGSSRTPWRAQPVRQTSPSACASHVGRASAAALRSASACARPRRRASRVCACARVSSRQRLRQPGASRTSSVRCRAGASVDVVDTVISAPWMRPQAQPPAPPARTPSSPRPCRGRSARARRGRAPAAAVDQLVGQRGAVEEREGGVAVQLDVAIRTHVRIRLGRTCATPTTVGAPAPAPRRRPRVAASSRRWRIVGALDAAAQAQAHAGGRRRAPSRVSSTASVRTCSTAYRVEALARARAPPRTLGRAPGRDGSPTCAQEARGRPRGSPGR